ncbi:MAG: sarcosine oxidase subunit gamma, partial [Aestuariivirgaceae bacterium]
MAKQATQKKSRATTAPVMQAKRISPLDHVIRRGRFGADREGGPGVTLSLRHPVSIVTVIARRSKARALSSALSDSFGFATPAPGRSENARGASIQWCGPEQWYIVREDQRDGTLHDELVEKLDRLASVSDQSHGRVIIALSGPKVRDVLAKGTPVDFHPRVFDEGDCAVTQMAHVGVHIVQTGTDSFE